jgi:hypothetical protein
MMQTYTRKSKFTELKPYDHFAKVGDFMEVTEWYNGEGFDVVIGNEQRFSLTHGQFQALVALVNYKE